MKQLMAHSVEGPHGPGRACAGPSRGKRMPMRAHRQASFRHIIGWVKEAMEKRSFPNPKELGLSSLFHICVRVPVPVSRGLPEGGSHVFHLGIPGTCMVTDTELTINTS